MSARPSRAWRVRQALQYASRQTDFHIREIREVCCLELWEDHLEILAEVRDVAPFELCTVYERPGYHTSSPSQEVRRVQLFRAAERNATEQARNYQVLRRHQPGNPLVGEARVAAAEARAIKELFESDLPDPLRAGDHCLMRIDRLIAADRDNDDDTAVA